MVTRIALMCPTPYRGGMLNTLKNTAILINEIKQQVGIDEVVVGLRTDAYSRDKIDEFHKAGVQVRHCDIIEVPKHFASRTLGAQFDSSLSKMPNMLSRPSDGTGGYDFLDCDLWMFWYPHTLAPLAPLRPYAAFLADAIPRIAPIPPSSLHDPLYDAFKGDYWLKTYNAMSNFQNAHAVFCTTPATMADGNSYFGIPRERLVLVPHMHASLSRSFLPPPPALDRPYFVWPTNTSYHKNQVAALDALVSYYQSLEGQFDVAVTGPLSQHLLDDLGLNYLNVFRERYRRLDRRTQRRIKFIGELHDDDVSRVFGNAEFLFQNVLYDNGTGSAMECGELGVPVVSADYPQMRYWIDAYGLSAKFFNPRDPIATGKVLKEAEIERVAGRFRGTFKIRQDQSSAAQNAYLRLIQMLQGPRRSPPHFTLPRDIERGINQ